jgi:hypothetical protein
MEAQQEIDLDLARYSLNSIIDNMTESEIEKAFENATGNDHDKDIPDFELIPSQSSHNRSPVKSTTSKSEPTRFKKITQNDVIDFFQKTENENTKKKTSSDLYNSSMNTLAQWKTKHALLSLSPRTNWTHTCNGSFYQQRKKMGKSMNQGHWMPLLVA